MGSPSSEEGRDNDETPHTVRVGEFSLGETEVTQAQWQAVMGWSPNPADVMRGFGRAGDVANGSDSAPATPKKDTLAPQSDSPSEFVTEARRWIGECALRSCGRTPYSSGRVLQDTVR